MERIFLIKASKAVTAPIFSPRSMASQGGRMDLIARSIIYALRRKNRVRRDTSVYVILEGEPNPPLLLRINGSELMELPVSETSVGELILEVLRGGEIVGITIEKKSFKNVLRDLVGKYGRKNIVYLHEKGADIRDFPLKFEDAIIFVLGDHLGIDRGTEEWLFKLGINTVSLGPLPYLTSHCIIIVHEELDRRERSSRL